jgi:hypothetical protein
MSYTPSSHTAVIRHTDTDVSGIDVTILSALSAADHRAPQVKELMAVAHGNSTKSTLKYSTHSESKTSRKLCKFRTRQAKVHGQAHQNDVMSISRGWDA